MKLSLILCAVLVATISSANGGLWGNKQNKLDRPWMLMKGDNGRIGIVFLKDEPSFVTGKDVTNPRLQIKFLHYSRSNRLAAVQIFVDSISGSFYDGSKNTYFVIHGWNGSPTNGWVIDFKDSLLDVEDCNVIVVDWSDIAGALNYNTARNDVQPTGEYVGQMHQYLATRGGAPARTHCVGHSLGAHVCGVSGGVLKLGRITGMDPALPLFENALESERLSTGDADYVDIIHTCGGWLGFLNPIGHADFYPNGGTDPQPGCNDVTGDCSHGRSHDYFLESIKSNQFRARECISWDVYITGNCASNALGIMGYPSSTSTRGNFYLRTNSNSPYAQG